MKKLTLGIGAVIVLALVGVAFASMGALKTDVVTANPDRIPVGWTVFNSTPNDDLIVEMHVAGIESDKTFTLELKNQVGHEFYFGAMTTNDEGNGNAHVVGSVPEYMADEGSDTVWVRAILRDPGTGAVYYRALQGYEIPVK